MYNLSDNFVNINERMKQLFFFDKKVQLQQNVFDDFYLEIFPCPKYFMDFLSANNREQQTICSKKIINRVFFLKHYSITSDLFNNLIDMEESEILKTDDKYMPRDHSVHSVYTYLLGIYLFFSLETFNNQLNKYFSSSEFDGVYSHESKEYNVFLSFLDSWKLFAFNHDIGYPLEYLIDGDGHYKHQSGYDIVKTINNISEYILTELSIYNILFFVAINIILQNSSVKLIDKINSLEITSNDLFNDIQQVVKCENYIKLDGIFSNKTMNYYSEVFNNDKLICLYIDKKEIAGYYFNEKQNSRFYLGEIDKILSRNIDNASLEFYYPAEDLNLSLKKVMKDNPEHLNDIDEFTSDISSKYSIDYASITSHQRYMDFLYEIYNCIKTQIKDASHHRIIVDEKYYESKFDKLVDYFLDDLKSSLRQNRQLDLNLTVKETLSKNLLDLFESYKNKENVYTVLDNFFSAPKSKDHNLIYIYNSIYSNLKNSMVSEQSLFWEINDSSFFLKKSKESGFNNLLKTFIDISKELALHSNLIISSNDFKKIERYNTQYYAYDHGICSAYIAIETYYKVSSLINSECWNSFIKPSIMPQLTFMHSCYAILIHNIYSSYFTSLCNSSKEVKHDILKNPFVYFALFCDNMQIWDRPFSINHGRINLTIPTISNKEMSIDVFDNHIYLKCKTFGMENIIYKYRQGLDDYLKNGSKLISLDVIEE